MDSKSSKLTIYEHMGQIIKQLNKGVLITTHHKGKTNTMTISWGKVGIEWNKPIFCAYVRKSRFTHEMLESGEFTVNVPIDDTAKKILSYCGTNSGRDTDKIKDMNLTTVRGKWVSAPAFKELPLTLECKVIFKHDQPESTMSQDIIDNFYPLFEDHTRDFHDMFYGEIVDAYIVE